MADAVDIKEQIRAIFMESLRAIDTRSAVRRAVKFSELSRLTIFDEVIEEYSGIYAIALGKAAYPMALALDDILGDKINGGVISGILPENALADNSENFNPNKKLSDKWRIFAGGHPLPNEASLAAAQSCINLLRSANNKQSLVIFLVSGGGSAMIESALDDSVTLDDLRQTNRLLVSCGASITEVNTIRRALSRIKGGGLAKIAAQAAQISLIVSDTEPGDESSVASGPTIESDFIEPDEIISIIKRYKLDSHLPDSVLNVLLHKRPEKDESAPENLRRQYILLDNQSAIDAAVSSAKARGFIVETADNISQQPVEWGCAEITRQMNEFCRRIGKNKIACLISGGEFSCPVRGNGTGGRNSETALRMALMFDNSSDERSDSIVTAFLSAGTDGIDGNSPAAGAVSDNTTLNRARALNLDVRHYLENSDAYTFFHALEDSIITNPTGTNVRDLRIMIART